MPYQRVIYVEGSDDLHAIGHLLDQNGIQACVFDEKLPSLEREVIAVKALGGYPKLPHNLQTELQASSELLLAGIVVDANEKPAARWESLSNRIREIGGQQVPESLPAEGWVGEARLPDRNIAVGAWLMPNNQAQGALEEFAVALMKPGDPLWEYANICVAGLEDHMVAERFEKLPKSKARVHTWLAWQEDPGMPIGASIRDHILDPKAQAAQHFVAWVRRLFGG